MPCSTFGFCYVQSGHRATTPSPKIAYSALHIRVVPEEVSCLSSDVGGGGSPLLLLHLCGVVGEAPGSVGAVCKPPVLAPIKHKWLTWKTVICLLSVASFIKNACTDVSVVIKCARLIPDQLEEAPHVRSCRTRRPS